jgi:hypothetical protein
MDIGLSKKRKKNRLDGVQYGFDMDFCTQEMKTRLNWYKIGSNMISTGTSHGANTESTFILKYVKWIYLTSYKVGVRIPI